MAHTSRASRMCIEIQASSIEISLYLKYPLYWKPFVLVISALKVLANSDADAVAVAHWMLLGPTWRRPVSKLARQDRLATLHQCHCLNIALNWLNWLHEMDLSEKLKMQQLARWSRERTLIDTRFSCRRVQSTTTAMKRKIQFTLPLFWANLRVKQ